MREQSNEVRCYRVLLSEDGSILQAFRQDPGEPWRVTDRHHNTGYPFRCGRKLPGIPRCLECCRKAAFYIPEMRYIGWDVAVTQDGPVIVEANNLSGSIYTYQQAKECNHKNHIDTAIGTPFEKNVNTESIIAQISLNMSSVLW